LKRRATSRLAMQVRRNRRLCPR